MIPSNFGVFDDLLDGIQVIDGNLVLRYLNSAARAQFGWSSEVAMGNDFGAICVAKGSFELEQLASTCLRERTEGRRSLSFPDADGQKRQLEIRFQPFHDGLLLTSATLRENTVPGWNEEEFRLLFEEMQEALLVMKAVRSMTGEITDLRIVAFNTAAATKLCEQPAMRLIGRLRSTLLMPPDAQTLALYTTVIDGDRRIRLEQVIPGEDAYASLSLFRPGPDHIAILSMDVTELKRIENKLTMVNEQLEYLVEEKTVALRIALDRASASSALKSTFLSMTSHELDTPLAAIRLSLSVLDRYNTGRLRKERARYHEHIEKETHNLLDLLERVRRVSPIVDRAATAGRKLTDLPTYAGEIVHEIGLLTHEHQSISMICEGDETVMIDTEMLRRILINLLSNAIKYSYTDVELRLSVRQGCLEVTVTDRGIGIPAAEQHRVFSKNFRAANTGAVRGMGLGLNIVATYVRLMDGEIGFDSVEGRGTVFWVSLPTTVN